MRMPGSRHVYRGTLNNATSTHTHTTYHIQRSLLRKSHRKSIAIFHFGSSVGLSETIYFISRAERTFSFFHSFIKTRTKKISIENNNKYSFLCIKCDMRPSTIVSFFLFVFFLVVVAFIHSIYRSTHYFLYDALLFVYHLLNAVY